MGFGECGESGDYGGQFGEEEGESFTEEDQVGVAVRRGGEEGLALVLGVNSPF